MPELVIPEFRVPVSRLRVGVFIRLDDIKWYDHPFLFKSFKITNEKQLQILRQLAIQEVICVPARSDVLPLKEGPEESKPLEKVDSQDSLEELWKIKQERALRLKERQEEIARCEKRYAETQQQVSRLIKGITSGSTALVQEVGEFADTFSSYFLENADSALHLMRVSTQDEGLYHHAMNVTVLAMMLGKEVGLTPEEMKSLCQGALLHDIGKSRIDKKVALKEKGFTRAELDFLRLHPKYGVEILAALQNIPKPILIIVYQHHEAWNGTGYPTGLKGEEIDLLSRITAIANTYDNHCNKRVAADCMTPFEALATMFSVQKELFDQKLLASFIRCLGIYPPGTVVQLNNGSIGMVISVNPQSQLHPSIVMYDPEIPQKDALIVEMLDEPELKIVNSIRPAALPPEIFNYLSPRSRVTYFVDTTETRNQ